MNLRVLSAATALLLAPCLSAQQASSDTGTVTGHVTLGDSQRPARFAGVVLFGVPNDLKPKADPDPKDMKAMMAAVREAMSGMNLVQGQTDLVGDFSLTGVSPGDYYVFATVPGFLQPINQVQAMFEAGVDLSKPLPGVPIVNVVAEHSAQAQVTIDRGAAIEGRFLWDDGTPVTRATVMLDSVKADKKKELPKQFATLNVASVASGSRVAITDDLGRFRISGISAGEYYVHGSVQTHMQFSLGKGIDISHMMSETPLVVYAPAAFHKSGAKTITLRAGDNNNDVLLTLNVNATHTVSGRVASTEDHHGINAATVKVTDAADKDFSRSTSVDAQGNFALTFVPTGTYDVEVSDAEDTEPAKKKGSGLFATSHTLRSYDDKKSSVIVADANVSGLSFELTPSKKTKEDIDLNSLMKSFTDDDEEKPKKP